MSRVRHNPASPPKRRSLRLSAFTASVAIHGVALGAIAVFSVAPPRAEREPEVEAQFATWVPEIAQEEAVPPPAAGDVARPEELLDATESAELEDPLAAQPEFAAPEVIALASRFGSGRVRFAPRRVRGGTGQAAGPAFGAGEGPGGDGDPVSAPSVVVAPSAPPPAPPEVVRVAARVLRTAKPEYPERARERGDEGRVVLVAEVLADGSVGEVEVLTSSGVAALDEAAVECVRRRWRFDPAHEDGVAVRARVRLPVFIFRIDD